ncbi:MAG TPA: NTP transferase domain-containing protein [Candidatus Omnitrophota bacterium]|nr:NTP transferase domain-containing protein [Candidatus Omnitrophota bacterium]HQJ15450.1 NTP transferase domain-containing protein [Candidatus Omnitrophota bacterium]
MKNKGIAAIILAAGKGTRMKSDFPKVLHPVCGRPMVLYVMDLVKQIGAERHVVVLGYKADQVSKVLPAATRTVIQKRVIGTADAVKQAMPALRSFNGTVVILYGDTPLLKKDTISSLLKRHAESGAAATILTAVMDDPSGYGRILRDEYNSICGIREDKDCDDFQKEIKEINTGIICFDSKKLEASLKKVKPNNRKKEYYLTDVIGILRGQGDLIEGVCVKDANEALGVNSRVELAQANKTVQRKINESFMKAGVTIVDPDTTLISHGTSIGADTTIYPFTVIENFVKINSQCKIGPFAHIKQGARIRKNTVVVGFPSSYNT